MENEDLINIKIDDIYFKIEKGESILEILRKNKEKFNNYRKYIAAELEEKGLKDLTYRIKEEKKIKLVDKKDNRAYEILKHSTAHLMAQAVLELYPDVQVGVGPAIENGFYYDFYREEPFSKDDLQKIENRMKKIRKKNIPVQRIELPKQEAIELFEKQNQELKVELIKEKSGEITSLYKQGDFIDFCKGPHVPSTQYIEHFKILNSSAAYWKGDENNVQMQRIYGTVFFEKEELDNYLRLLKEAEKRDHRKLGKKLELFHISEEVGPGLISWLPKGAYIRRKMEDFWVKEHYKAGYEILNTPHIAKVELWEKSGHLSFYKENMFPPMEFDNTEYQLKPMNCPFHIDIYKSKLRSYKEFPIRWAELGTVYRYERSGVLHGLLRVRGFTQDDAHIFTLPSQLENEIENILNFNFKIIKAFGFEDYEVFLSTRPEKFVGKISNWDKAEQALKNALEKNNINYSFDPGEGVFYGPKIDIKIKDILGRSWQCSTIQVDFNLPEQFNMDYIDKNDNRKKPTMIHRALLGSFERFFGILIEHYGGKFPLWLSPCQIVLLPVSEKFAGFSQKIASNLKKESVRVKIDDRDERLGYRIREAEIEKIPYMGILGEREEKENAISIRIQGHGDFGLMSINDIINAIKKKENNKEVDYRLSEVSD